MFLLHLHLTGTADLPPGHGEAHAVQDLLWAHADPWHRLEHVTARSVSGGIRIVLFLAAPTAERAGAQAAELIADVSNSGLLTRYRISGTG
ncbi:hypothetical protein ACIBSR_17680 [Streptomyces sp. NPDC049936]|uniref:hypothetical protein n=1 Tax=Streptomyces sp. NPDC049936 TaxID=3365599 RepID=UPI0037912E7D